jgi:hypothetical protein
MASPGGAKNYPRENIAGADIHNHQAGQRENDVRGNDQFQNREGESACLQFYCGRVKRCVAALLDNRESLRSIRSMYA